MVQSAGDAQNLPENILTLHSCQSIHISASVHLLALTGDSHGIQLHSLMRSDYVGNIVMCGTGRSCMSNNNLNVACA